ncbi:hypothetical protein G7072_16655 [Nocardioides sp. HDW12B]|uniref:hypothetical protein n=1 Tax=Nocardioides sp. HDW12B TaxID=2714939 RepID=UPI00140E12EB|nr:hypothetical protein [Nocardioides sp. HDW12B]QIK67759.1 hypothetical protein G7072_16655 [Nocardioides sp. HDW12B]
MSRPPTDASTPPTATPVTDGRRRRDRRVRAALVVAAGALAVAVVAGVAAVAAGVVRVDALRDGDESSAGPDVVSSPAAGGSPSTVARGPVQVGRDSVGGLPFGTSRGEVLSTVTERLGEPEMTVDPTAYERIPGQRGWFEDGADNLSPSWAHRVAAVTCWQRLCVIFGGGTPEDLALRGWELADHRRWGDEPGPVRGRQDPEVRVEGGTTLGDTWGRLSTAYPRLTVAGGEGASVTVRDLPWPGIFDGVGEWRLSGPWDPTRPAEAPAGARVTRLSGGEGPEPGCC